MMTDQPQDVCRLIAEQIWEAIPAYEDSLHKEEEIKDFEKALSNHTIVPEMVRMLEVVEQQWPDSVTGRQVHKLLAKAGRTS